MASFRSTRSKFVLPSILLPFMVILTQLLGALIVFGFLGYYTQLTNTTFEDLKISGPDLLFVTYPQILQTIPLSNIWCIMFYLVIILLGIDSQFAMTDVIIYLVKDLKIKYKGEYFSSATMTGAVCTLMGI
jgi:SNF family Na+-dependent transporter